MIKLQKLLEDLLKACSLRFSSIEGRPKKLPSFIKKINRPGKSYKNPLKELSDLAALRVIVYYAEDIDRVCSILNKEFRVDKIRSIDKRKELSHDQFGYNSVHKVVYLSKSRRNLSEWMPFKNMVAEIQVRTVLQHAWASISHALQYKKEIEIPVKFRRKLSRLSGLLELADEQFLELRHEQDELVKKIDSLVWNTNLELPIDLISVRKYIVESPRIQKIFNDLKKSQLRLVEYYEDRATELVSLCYAMNIQTIGDLDKRLASAKNRYMRFFNTFGFQYALEAEMNLLTSIIRGDIAHRLSVLLAGLSWSNKDLVEKGCDWNALYIAIILKTGKKYFRDIIIDKKIV